MNTPILNRDTGKLPTDGWHQIEVPGEHINHDAKVVQVIDAKAIESIVNRFAADAAKPHFAGILVDQDHFSLDNQKSSEAMGWAMELRNRGGIPEARIDWTSAGRPKVEGKDYKFFSTVYEPADFEVITTRVVNGAKYQVVRPLHLSRLALTNDPNNKGGKPISNRQGNPADAAENQKNVMKTLLKKLGLAEDASEESAVSALQAITNRATTAENSVSALTTERDALLAAQVEADLDKHAEVIANRDEMKKQLIANRSVTLAVLAGLKKPEKKAPATITNRGTATQPSTAIAADDATIDAKRTAAVQQYRIANRGASFQQAWEAVRAEKPELFADPVAE